VERDRRGPVGHHRGRDRWRHQEVEPPPDVHVGEHHHLIKLLRRDDDSAPNEQAKENEAQAEAEAFACGVARAGHFARQQ
jgi:hypothetical protein